MQTKGCSDGGIFFRMAYILMKIDHMYVLDCMIGIVDLLMLPNIFCSKILLGKFIYFCEWKVFRIANLFWHVLISYKNYFYIRLKLFYKPADVFVYF